MAGVINLDGKESQVESPESSARQFNKQPEIKETKGNETEKIWKRLPLLPNKINNNNILDDIDKAFKYEIAELKRTIAELEKEIAGLKIINSEQEKTIIELKLTRKHIEEGEGSQSGQDQCTQTEALPILPFKPTPPKEGVPRKNGRHHRRHQTYPSIQDSNGMPSNSYRQHDVGIQTVLPSNTKKGLPVLIVKLESKGRRLSLHYDHEPHTPDCLPPIPAGDIPTPVQ